ncbi:hypothetical protein PPYR_13287 [Photinus pyralis]|uniref:Uncharacterized protein n=1 Tax=Photinus pyralis TaxID=7054 RepID=A0A5N4A8N7_PHOPY|nr:serine/arginine repetitive matrix protein 1-like [Photinus pyralis]KAB0793667.1 hypothetical protein PPYR_13287 [Photinus pyralis]
MQPYTKKLPSDEEEDLESLRLAALQSLKRSVPSVNTFSLPTNNTKIYKKTNKRGRGCHVNARNNRNGVFGSRIRNSNLISVPTVETEVCQSNASKKPAEALSKLILPQDRYSKQADVEEKAEPGSKFDRYKDSESESDSDSEDVTESREGLQRSSSLEALMQELENEIQRDAKKEEVPNVKQVKKVKLEEVTSITVAKVKPPAVEVIKKTVKDVHPPQPSLPQFPVTPIIETNGGIPENTNSYVHAQVPFPHTQQFFNFNPCPTVPYDPNVGYNFPPINPMEGHVKPTYYERPLSPLSFDTGVFNTITAPLSPRSAAFVLQNREIIERRKKSPRRSYSRSPSPRYRRSNSRSESPVRQRESPGSCSNARKSQSYKRSPPSRYGSPKRRRRSPAKRRHFSPCKEMETKEHTQTRAVSLSLSPSPERFTPRSLADEKQGVDDSVLEARRKKFESDAVPTEGIIRLRPKVDQNEQLTEDDKSVDGEEGSADEGLSPSEDTYIDLNLKVNDLFSDEDSDDENEGRFKSKSNDSLKDVERPRKLPRVAKDNSRKKRHNDYDRDTKTSKKERRDLDGAVVANSRHKSHLAPLENRKIEIKIRNPGKYESEIADDGKEKIVHSRKVEVTNRVSPSDSEETEVDVKSEGSVDLRAQLSRKRAERQHMVPKSENNPSRLLQNALQGAVFKKQPKVKTNKKEKDSSALDAKLPIHLRLGIPDSVDTYNEPKVDTKNVGKRSKNRTKYEQV